MSEKFSPTKVLDFIVAMFAAHADLVKTNITYSQVEGSMLSRGPLSIVNGDILPHHDLPETLEGDKLRLT